MVRVMWKLSTY